MTRSAFNSLMANSVATTSPISSSRFYTAADASRPARDAVPASSLPMRRHRRHHPRPGYTLVELMATFAVLVIVLGLMVSLARRARAESADAIPRALLSRLDVLMADYLKRNGKPPQV